MAASSRGQKTNKNGGGEKGKKEKEKEKYQKYFSKHASATRHRPHHHHHHPWLAQGFKNEIIFDVRWWCSWVGFELGLFGSREYLFRPFPGDQEPAAPWATLWESH
ncbi:Hypothetical predicted protein [Drosophila guanche]|uniref:Uncharacterized protein n=1 Tax=Drosophila guanche TaxID=7266 RepID=A0A3B0K0Y2_DROGU|nr:Hypothetical predicted protein [Drosophila guanche]